MKLSIDFTDIGRIDVSATEAIYVADMHDHFEKSKKKLQEATEPQTGKFGKKPKKRPNLKSYLQENLVEYRRGLELLKEKEKLKNDLKSRVLSTEGKNEKKVEVARITNSIKSFQSIEFVYFAGIHRPNGPTGAVRIHSKKNKLHKGKVSCYESYTTRVPIEDRSVVITLEETFQFLTNLWRTLVANHPSINHETLFSLINSKTHYGVTSDMCKAYVNSVATSLKSLERNEDEESSEGEDDSSVGSQHNGDLLMGMNSPNAAKDVSMIPKVVDKDVSSRLFGNLSENVEKNQEETKDPKEVEAPSNPSHVEGKKNDCTKLPSEVTALSPGVPAHAGSVVVQMAKASNTNALISAEGSSVREQNVNEAVAIAVNVHLLHQQGILGERVTQSDLNAVGADKEGNPKDSGTKDSGTSLSGKGVVSAKKASGSSGQDNQKESGSGDVGGKSSTTTSGSKGDSQFVNLLSEGSDNEDGENNEESIRHSENLGLFEKAMAVGLPQKKFYHIMINIVTVEWKANFPQHNKGPTHSHMLVVQCLLTKFILFRRVALPTNVNEITGLLSIMFGDFGYPRTVSYFNSAIAFNCKRYNETHSTGTYNVSFDSTTPFGDDPYRGTETNRLSFLVEVHNSLFGKKFVDDMDRHIGCIIDPNSFLDDDMSKVVEVFIEKVQSLWVCDMPVASHYPSAQLHVNVRKNFFYGPAGKSNFPFEEKYQAPFEKMFNRLAFVHTYPKENPFAISNFWMGTNKCFMDSDEYCSKVKDQRRRVDDPSHYVQYTTYHKNLKRMYSFKSGEVLHYPPLLTPPSIPTDMKDTLVLEINESRLKAVLDSRERHHVPVGIVNENRSCAMNAVYRLMQDIPHMNDILNKVVHSLACKGGKPIVKDLVCAYVYCGRLLFDKCAQHNVAKNRRNISIDTLTVAFENKVFNHSSAHNDLVELDKDECAGQVLRVLMNFLQKEVYTVDMEKGESFSNLFKKRFMETYECQVCESSSWTTFFGPAEDNFTVTVAVPKTVDTNLRCLHKPSKDECFDIHLQDLMRLSSKNFNTPLVDLKECKSIKDYKKIHEGANLSECSITKQTTFLTSVPYVILELNRTHIVSHAFKKGDPFVTEHLLLNNMKLQSMCQVIFRSMSNDNRIITVG